MKTLASQPVGLYFCNQISGPRDAQIRLKRLGICENRPIELVRHGDPMVLNVVGARIGVSRYLAQNILVEASCPVETSSPVEANGPVESNSDQLAVAVGA